METVLRADDTVRWDGGDLPLADIESAPDEVLARLQRTARDMHDFSRAGWFWIDLAVWSGERMPAVLARLRRAELRAAEAEARLLRMVARR